MTLKISFYYKNCLKTFHQKNLLLCLPTFIKFGEEVSNNQGIAFFKIYTHLVGGNKLKSKEKNENSLIALPHHHTHNQREESSFKNPNKHQQRMRKTIKIYNSLNVNIAIFLFILCSAGKNSSVKVNAGALYC